jgi:hypothetical protein
LVYAPSGGHFTVNLSAMAATRTLAEVRHARIDLSDL